MKDLGGLLKTMQDMQSKVADSQKRMEALTSEGQAGAGLVKLSLQGDNRLSSIKIDPSLLNPEEVEILEDLIKAAFEDGRKKLEEQRKSVESDLMGGISLPPGLNLPF